jgi:splicing factor 3A subunit 2
MDYQNRPGGKAGGGGAASQQQEAIDRRERLRKLALETIDLRKDPYFMRNHLGQYECKLCLTLHPNEGNYLAHTQGKRHQQGLAKRAAMDARDAAALPAPLEGSVSTTGRRKGIVIGRPGYKVLKALDPTTGQKSLLFEIDYAQIEEGLQPRHRFMSAYEQKVEAPDRSWQYLLFAADPYQVIAFKIPSWEIDRAHDKLTTQWDPVKKVFTLQLFFKLQQQQQQQRGSSNMHY